MGIPFYGRGFILEDPDWDGLYCPAIEGMAGVWGYQEILKTQNNDTLVNLPGAEPHQWKIVVDDCYRTPYMGIYIIIYEFPSSRLRIIMSVINFFFCAHLLCLYSIEFSVHIYCVRTQ